MVQGHGNHGSLLLPQESTALAVPGPFLFGLAFVVELFTASQRKLDLGASLFVEIKFERDERHALALHRTDQFVDLTAMQQKLSRSFRRVIEAVCLPIFGHVCIDKTVV